MVMVTDREFEPPLEVIGPLTVGVHVAVEVTCTEGKMGLLVVTTTALAVAQYCKVLVALAAEGNTKSLLVLSRLVTVTISRFAAEEEFVYAGVIETEDISCIFLFLDLVMGPILVMDTEPVPEVELLDPTEDDADNEQLAAVVIFAA